MSICDDNSLLYSYVVLARVGFKQKSNMSVIHIGTWHTLSSLFYEITACNDMKRLTSQSYCRVDEIYHQNSDSLNSKHP
jgi:hypothetical protein